MRALAALAALVAVVAVGVVAAPAPAAWREQRLTAGPTLGIDLPALATNERGDTAVAWREGERTYVAVRRARAARFGRRIALRPHATPYVAVLSDGTVLVATLRNDGTEGGRRPCCQAAYIQRLAPGSRRLSAPRVATVRGSSLSGLAISFAAGPGGRAALIADADGILVVTSRARGIFGLPGRPHSVASGAGRSSASAATAAEPRCGSKDPITSSASGVRRSRATAASAPRARTSIRSTRAPTSTSPKSTPIWMTTAA